MLRKISLTKILIQGLNNILSSPQRWGLAHKKAKFYLQWGGVVAGLVILIGLLWSFALIDPFVKFGFLRRALFGCWALSLSACPLGVFLILRRMSLMGDALSHGLLPGIALAFCWYGFSTLPMTIGGMIAGACVVLVAGYAGRHTLLYEDAHFSACYLTAMALGIVLLAHKGGQMDLTHILFGNVLGLTTQSLYFILAVASLGAVLLLSFFDAIVIECCDPVFFESLGGRRSWIHQGFLLVLIMNLVAAFQTVGTLMALGIMLIPAITARMWCDHIRGLCFLAIVLGIVSSYLGLLVSFYGGYPSGPSIILVMGMMYAASILVHTPLLTWKRKSVKGVFILGVMLLSNVFHSSKADTTPLRIVVSFTLLQSMVQELLPENANVQVATIVGPHGDPHVYEPKPQDLQALSQADVVIVNGLGFEPWLNRLIGSSGYKGDILVVTKGLSARHVNVGGRQVPDPHAWHDLNNATHYIHKIADKLKSLRPQWAQAIEENLQRFLKAVALQHKKYLSLSRFPKKRLCAIVPHEAFGYMGQAYGITFFSPMGISTENEPSARDIAALLTRIQQEGKECCIFLENSSSPHVLRQIALELGREDVDGVLFSEALSEPGGQVDSFVKFVEYNFKVLEEAFERRGQLCDKLERGTP